MLFKKRWHLHSHVHPIRFSAVTITTRIATGTTLVFVLAIAFVGIFSFKSFKNSLEDVLIAKQITAINEITDDLNLNISRLVGALQFDFNTAIKAADALGPALPPSPNLPVGNGAFMDRSGPAFSIVTSIGDNRAWLPKIRMSEVLHCGRTYQSGRSSQPMVFLRPLATDQGADSPLELCALAASSDALFAGYEIICTGLPLTEKPPDTVTHRSRSGYIFIVEKGGDLIASPDPGLLHKRAYADGKNALFERAVEGEDGSAVTHDLYGKRSLISYQRIRSTGWIVGLVSSEDEAFSAYDKLVRRLGVMLAISSVIAVISVWLYTRRMAQQLAFTYNQLQDMRVSATEKLQTRSRFFQEASHDFKQRLHAMQLLVQAAGRSTHADLPSHLRNLSHTVVGMETYVGDFLEYARLETSVDQPVLKTIHLQGLFQKLELAFEDIALEKNVELKIRVTGFCITTDEKMLLRAVENLMSNSIKFSRGKVLLAARKYPDHLAIEVWDNGTGIPRAQQNRVFDAFYKGSPAYGENDGVGLGLAIVKRLATALGYALHVNSVEGRSNVVKILIPLDRVAIGSDARA